MSKIWIGVLVGVPVTSLVLSIIRDWPKHPMCDVHGPMSFRWDYGSWWCPRCMEEMDRKIKEGS
jgi:hypothetical protein